MSTTTGKTLNLVKPELTDDHKVTIGTDLPANFQKIDDAVSAHLVDLVTDADGAHGLKIEEGTFTPKIIGLTTAGNHTYSAQLGHYMKMGNVVNIWGVVSLSAKDSAMAGSVVIDGLPFASSGTFPVLSGFTGNITIESGKTLIMSIGVGQAFIRVRCFSSDSLPTDLDSSAIKSDTTINFSATYKV